MTAYDHAIQATSGITAATGTETSGPIKVGAPVIDYAVGTTGAFALSAALYQTLRTGKGQYIDMAMLDVALILQALAHHRLLPQRPHQQARGQPDALSGVARCSRRATACVQLAASNERQHQRFYAAIGEPGEAERCSLDERNARYDEKQAMIARKMKEKTAQEWEDYLQSKHVPATRVRELHGDAAGPASEAPRRAAPARERARRRQAGDGAAARRSSSRTTARRSSARRRGWASTPTSAEGGGLPAEQIAALRRSGCVV